MEQNVNNLGCYASEKNVRQAILSCQASEEAFNDVLAFRLHLEEYPTEFPECFRVVDLRTGKQIDDGYRAIHLYYQRDNKAYPI